MVKKMTSTFFLNAFFEDSTMMDADSVSVASLNSMTSMASSTVAMANQAMEGLCNGAIDLMAGDTGNSEEFDWEMLLHTGQTHQKHELYVTEHGNKDARKPVKGNLPKKTKVLEAKHAEVDLAQAEVDKIKKKHAALELAAPQDKLDTAKDEASELLTQRFQCFAFVTHL
jgi:hypothetical protein